MSGAARVAARLAARLAALLAALLAASTAAGCGGGDGERDRPLVFAASSLREAAEQLGEADFVFAGSDALAAQIRDGAEADLFLSAAEAPVRDLRAAGLVAEPVPFASNRLVVVVPRRNPAGIARLADLARPGVKLVLGGPGVPIGDYARAALATGGLDGALENVVSLEDDVRGVLGKIVLDEADAGIVYATDVRAADGDVRVLAVPAEVQPPVRYLAAEVVAGDREAARRFLARLAGEDGRRALETAGFGAP